MNRNVSSRPSPRHERSPGTCIRCRRRAARSLLALGSLAIVLAPRAAWAQPGPGTRADAAPGSGLPIEVRLGVRGSLSAVTFHGDDSDNQFEESTFTLRRMPSFGIAAGVLAIGDVFEWRGGLWLDASYMTKGSGATADGEEIGRLDLRYYDFALLATLERELGKNVRATLLGGPGLSIVRDATLVIASDEYDITDETTDRDLRFVAGVGVAWALHPSHALTFDVRADIGTRTIDSTGNDSELKNLAISLSLGYQWSYPPRPSAAAYPDMK